MKKPLPSLHIKVKEEGKNNSPSKIASIATECGGGGERGGLGYSFLLSLAKIGKEKDNFEPFDTQQREKGGCAVNLLTPLTLGRGRLHVWEKTRKEKGVPGNTSFISPIRW